MTTTTKDNSTTTTTTVSSSSVQSQDAVVVEPPSRAVLRRARRVCVKAGTSVVANSDGRPSLTRLGAIVEQIAELVNNQGVQVIFVSSGAVGMGKRLLRKQSKMLLSFKDIALQQNNDNNSSGVLDGGLPPLMSTTANSGGQPSRNSSFLSLLDDAASPHTLEQKKKHYDSACAAAGQFEMMNLYSSLFAQCDIAASQILVTQADFIDASRLQNLIYAIERLLSLGIVPIINENDAVSGNMGYTPDDVFSDNDSLAALCARNFGAQVLLLLTDVNGVYDRPPSDPNAVLLQHYNPTSSSSSSIQIGAKSAQGRGGMASKIDAALSAVQPGSSCGACIVAAGSDLNCIRAVLGRQPQAEQQSQEQYKSRGTLFCTPGSDLEKQAIADEQQSQEQQQSATESLSSNNNNNDATNEARQKAMAARAQARKLQALPYSVRQDILRGIATALLEHKDEILTANAKDLEAAEQNETSLVLKKRLGLTQEKLNTLAAGMEQIATLSDPLGVVKCQRELAPNLILSQITVSIGVLLIIFESRPDSMPQIAALALASGNGLLLKGGKEAAYSNAAIHNVIGTAIEECSNGAIQRDIIALITSRGQVSDMLSLDDGVIDLVIPRGSNELVSYIKANTRIPVLGHADGVCHVYIDASADATSAAQIAVDAKVDYPSACNAMETLLLHVDTIQNGVASTTLMALRAAGVKCLGGPNAMKLGLCDIAASHLKYEYGDLTCMIEVVANVSEAIDWIHMYGSGHTESIVCGADDSDVGEEFLRRVDAACVFKNASTRFADGYRFGLGAEVGISTGRIHARGPVGVEGLLTTKWQLRSKSGINTVAEFAGTDPKKVYTHKDLM